MRLLLIFLFLPVLLIGQIILPSTLESQGLIRENPFRLLGTPQVYESASGALLLSSPSFSSWTVFCGTLAIPIYSGGLRIQWVSSGRAEWAVHQLQAAYTHRLSNTTQLGLSTDVQWNQQAFSGLLTNLHLTHRGYRWQWALLWKSISSWPKDPLHRNNSILMAQGVYRISESHACWGQIQSAAWGNTTFTLGWEAHFSPMDLRLTLSTTTNIRLEWITSLKQWGLLLGLGYSPHFSFQPVTGLMYE